MFNKYLFFFQTYVPLSPLPVVRSHSASPRRVSSKHAVYISPHKNAGRPLTPDSRMLYCFNRSPAKDMRAINNMIRLGDRKLQGKKKLDLLEEEEETGASLAKRFCQEQSPVIVKRLGEVQSDHMMEEATGMR